MAKAVRVSVATRAVHREAVAQPAGGGNSAAGANQAVDKKGVRFCFWHNNGGCSRDKCAFSHDTPPKDVRANMTAPPGRGRSPSPGGGRPRSQSPGGKGKGKGKGKKGGKALPGVADNNSNPQQNTGQTPKFGGLKKLWCPMFLKGNCKEPCPSGLPHVNEATKKVLQASVNAAIEARKKQQ